MGKVGQLQKIRYGKLFIPERGVVDMQPMWEVARTAEKKNGLVAEEKTVRVFAVVSLTKIQGEPHRR